MELNARRGQRANKPMRHLAITIITSVVGDIIVQITYKLIGRDTDWYGTVWERHGRILSQILYPDILIWRVKLESEKQTECLFIVRMKTVDSHGFLQHRPWITSLPDFVSRTPLQDFDMIILTVLGLTDWLIRPAAQVIYRKYGRGTTL